MNKGEAIELLDSELDILINKAHKAELNYWEIFKVFLKKSIDLTIQSEAEYHLKGGR